jgi:WhiB family redox-sensing transcriptional regulator
MDFIPADILAKYGQGFVMSTQGVAINTSVRSGATWEIASLKFPDFWGKGMAFCAPDPDRMFPEGKGSTYAEEKATVVCAGCPYILECLQFALENDEWGVWGGTTRAQRKAMRQRLGYV